MRARPRAGHARGTWLAARTGGFYLRPARPGARLRSEEAARELVAVLEPLRSPH